jgi:Na+-transporting NADH:ubiquinone oxidoreductase subunit A
MKETELNRRIRIRKGLNIPIAGEPEQLVHPAAAVSHVALCGPDYAGLKPRLMVAEGDRVEAGQTLFVDKRDSAVLYCTPGAGTVAAINRGVRRVLESVVVRLSDPEPDSVLFDALSPEQIESLDSEQAATRLRESGLWTAFRTRPFGRVPLSGSRPRSIFVTAVDTRPLAADPRVVIGNDNADFISGLRILPLLTDGSVFLCTGPGWDLEVEGIQRLETVAFDGPHPARLARTHIHHLDPVGPDRFAWHIGYQHVIAMGRLFTSGRIDTARTVALGGDGIEKPRLVRTRMGASIDELLEKDIRPTGGFRTVSGSVLDGRAAAGGLAFLGRYHQQVSVITEGGDRHLLGWLGLSARKYTAAPALTASEGRGGKRLMSTSQNGRFSGMIPLRMFERVMPLDILPSPLFRALLVRDTDRAQDLGCLELDEEDLALSSFVCPAKTDYGSALRVNLDQIEREG